MSRGDPDHPYLRYPHLHGDLLCFAAEDDLWVAPLVAAGADPERAWRLTVDRTRVGHPRFSPDGTRIAFTSWRSLDPEIHLVPTAGGPAQRLSYWGSTDTRVCSWTPPDRDGRSDILAVSSHGQPFSYFSWAYALPTDGSPGGKLPWGPVSDIAVADIEGERRTLLLAGKPPHEPASWKRYRGGATGRLWLHGHRLVPELAGHLESVMFVAGRIAFLSDHEGVGNLYSCLPDGTDLRRHTDHDAFYARHAATDGGRVVYQCAGDVWLVDDLSAGGHPRRLPVRLGGSRTGRRVHQVPAGAHINSLTVDDTGRASAVCVRGSLYWLTHRDGPARVIADRPGVRTRLPEMVGGTGTVAYVTDAAGEDAIEIAQLPRATGPTTPRRVAAGRLGRVHEMVAAPDGERLAVASHDGRLLLVDVAPDGDGAVRELLASANGPVRDLAFSPDSGWLAWSHPGVGRSLRQIRVARLADGAVLDVTNGRFEDEQPVFTRDGRYLAFLSWRGFDPVYDVHTGDLSFPLGCRPYLVPLSSATPSPFALHPEGRPAMGGLDPLPATDGEGTVLVEAEGLASRVTPFPVAASKYSSLWPVSGGGLVWLRWPISGALGETFANPADTSGSPTLEHFDLCHARRTELTGAADWFAASGDGTRLVVADDGGGLRAIPATELADPDTTVPLDLRRVLHEVDPAAEWRGAYEEAGRIVRDYFWDPGMSQVDWDAVLDQYRPLVERVASPDEFADLLREVLGELGTSHAYVTPARRNEGPPHYQRAIGFLGANLTHAKDGSWRLARVLPGESSDSRARSPLAGSGIREGAALTHVDGRPVDPVTGPGPLLAAAGGTTVELTFSEPAPDRPPEPAAYPDQAEPASAADSATGSDLGPTSTSEPSEEVDIGAYAGLDAAPTADADRDAAPSDEVAPGPGADGDGAATATSGGHGDPVEPAGADPLVAGRPGEWAPSGRGRLRPMGVRPPRRVAVVPLIDERPLRYQDWVAKRREVVWELSRGRCGYLHIPDMGGSGWAQFNRDLRMEMARPSLIVDVRGNAGGNISELVVEKLTRTILGWDLTRHAQPVSYASNAPRGPIVALADEMTSSDGDMITAAIRMLGLGPVVGLRTWGGVVGMTGRHRLGDGTVITVPMNAAWFEGYGWGVENHGVEPDIEVDRTPLDWAEGRHRQLDDAVELALELLERHPAAQPPDYSDLPDRRRPALPPRRTD